MKQTTKTLLGLLVLLVLAGAVGGLAVWTGKSEEKKAEEKAKSEKLFDFDKAQVKEVRLTRDGKLVAALVKGDKGWALTEPIKGEGDDTTVDSLLTTLSGLQQTKELDGEKDLKPYGLDAPHLEIAVKLNDGKEQALQVGGDNSFANTLYVKKAGDPVVRLIDAWKKNDFDKQLFDFRNKSVAHLAGDAWVKRVEVTTTQPPPARRSNHPRVAQTYVLDRDSGVWKYDGAPADSGMADGVVAQLKNLRATGIAADAVSERDLGKYGLDDPRLYAKVSVASGKDTLTRTVRIGQAKGSDGKPKTYAKRDDSPVVFEVNEIVLKDLDKSPFDLQDKQLLHVTRDDIRKLVFDSPEGGHIEVTRAKVTPADGGFPDEQYEVVAPQKGPARKWKVSAASYSVPGLRAAAFDGPEPKAQELKKYGLDKPKTVTLLGEKDKVLARVRFGAVKNGKRYALVDGFGKLAEVDKGTVDDLPWTLAVALDMPAPGSADAGVQAAK